MPKSQRFILEPYRKPKQRDIPLWIAIPLILGIVAAAAVIMAGMTGVIMALLSV